MLGLGALCGALFGVIAVWLANVLPKRANIEHLPSAAKQRRRNVLLVIACIAVGGGVGRVLSGVEDATWHLALLLVVNTGVSAVLLAGFAIDWEHMILPNEITLGTTLVCLVTAPLRSVGITSSLLGAVVAFAFTYAPFLLYKLVTKRSGMGVGDAKLAVAAGAWHGIAGMFFMLFFGALQHILLGYGLRAAGLGYEIPESVQAEIAALRKRAAEGDKEAADELADDPLAAEGLGEGTMKMRLPMGPALILASIEVLFLRRWLLDTVVPWLFG